MNLSIPVDTKECEYTHDDLAVKYTVRAPTVTDRFKAQQDAGVTTADLASGDEAATNLLVASLGARCCASIVSVESGGEAVTVNGKPATDADVMPLLLSAIQGLAISVGVEALDLEAEIEGSIKNSLGVPDSHVSYPQSSTLTTEETGEMSSTQPRPLNIATSQS